MSDFPEAAPARPLWLVTLADLALLLVGYLVLIQAAGHDGRALADGMRRGFATPAAAAPAIPVAAAGIGDFAPGSAVIAHVPPDLTGWARDTLRDPRLSLTITGSTDGTPGDSDPASGSAAILAADRARSLAVVLAPVARGRIVITTGVTPGRRAAIVTSAFTGTTTNRTMSRRPS